MSNKQNKKAKQSKKKEPLALWMGLGTLVAVGIFSYFSSQPPASLEKAHTPEQIKQGETLFAQNCVSCHGPQGRGEDPNNAGGGVKADGMSRAPALNGLAHSWHHPTEMLFNKIKHGAEDPKTSAMPAFKERFNDEEIVAVLNYIKYSLWPEDIQMKHAMGGKHSM